MTVFEQMACDLASVFDEFAKNITIGNTAYRALVAEPDIALELESGGFNSTGNFTEATWPCSCAPMPWTNQPRRTPRNGHSSPRRLRQRPPTRACAVIGGRKATRRPRRTFGLAAKTSSSAFAPTIDTDPLAMDEAVTLFTDEDGITRVIAGPEQITEARKRLAQAMADKSSKPGTMEIWSRRGVTDRFVFRAAEEEAEDSPEPTEAFEE